MNNLIEGKFGIVIQVNSDRVMVEVNNEIKNYNLIYKGLFYRIGQVGSFIKIVTGLSSLYGVVESFSTFATSDNIVFDKKVITIALLGYKGVDGEFKKGSRVTPSINDGVYIITEDDIEIIFKNNTNYPLRIGDNYFNKNLPAIVNLNEFILKHSFISGSTGSGKSNLVAYILKNMITDYSNSRALIIDIHGEYSKYLGEYSNEFSVSGGGNIIKIPYWLLKFEYLCKLFGFPINTISPSSVTEEFRDKIIKLKKEYVENHVQAAGISEFEINVDSPIPFSIKKIWYDFYCRGYGTYMDLQRTILATTTEGNAEELKKPVYQPYVMGSKEPYKSNELNFRNYADNLEKIFKNDNYKFLFEDYDEIINTKENNFPIHEYVNDIIKMWIDNDKKISILNLSQVPYQVLDLTISAITNFIFDIIYQAQKNNKVFEGRPILICFEEAHKYVNEQNTNSFSLETIKKIMKEGRKFGIGAMLISQRPVEMSNTILSQVNTFITLRQTNSDDQSKIISFSPNNFSIFLKELSSIGIGEAFVIGESMNIPMKIQVPLLKEVKETEFDKKIEIWKGTGQSPNYIDVIKEWIKK